MTDGYGVGNSDGKFLAARISAPFDNNGRWRWTAIQGRAHRFSTQEEADRMVAALLEEDPGCGASTFEWYSFEEAASPLVGEEG